MRILETLALIVVLSFGSVVAAQQAAPDHRYLLSRDMDFFGADLTNLFDTTEQACARACSAQKVCVAYTFNTRSNACFPKSAITERQPYAGAISARKIPTDAEALKDAAAREADLVFLGQADLQSASRLVQANASRFSFDQETLEALTTAMAQSEQAGNAPAALRWAGKAVALSDRADLWVNYSRLALTQAKAGDRATRQRSRREAVQSAVNGYLRAGQPGVRVEALRALANALEASRRGRDMIPALRLAERIQPRKDTETALEKAIGKYGFRIVRHRIDNDAAAPRICAEFSDKLVQAGVDYEPFIRVVGRGLAVQADDSQICIDGVEHGARYDVTFRTGLPAASGEALHKDVTLRLYVRDRAPSVRFPGRAYVLPRSSDAALPVETVNTATLDLTLRRVSDRNLVRALRERYFGKPLSAYEDDVFAADLAQDVWTGTGTVQNELNVDMTTRLPMAAALADQPPGIYVLSAAVPGQDKYEAPAAMQWFVLSDLGLSTWSGVDGLHVAVRSLADTSPEAGVTLSLISRANAVLGTVVTDEEGFATFPAGLTRGTGTAQSALLMAQDSQGGIAFLPLTEPAFDLSDRGVEGRAPAPPIDTFLTTDRGAYRVGEVIYATALTRDSRAAALKDLPITAVLKRPDGVEYSRQLSKTPKAGGHVFALSLGPDVPRGAWRVDILSDVKAPALASQVVLVEDFLPERIDFDISLPDAPLSLGQRPPVEVDVRYLFGAPGAGLKVHGTLRLRALRSRAGWEGYRFGRYDSAFRTQTSAIAQQITDAQGRATTQLDIARPEEDPGVPLEAEVILRVAEGSGRPVERRISKAITPDTAMIAIKPLFDGVLDRGAQAGFDVVALTPDNARLDMPVRWTVNRVETRYQWYQLNGNWEWEPITRRIRVSSGTATLGQNPVTLETPTDWGTYELVVEHTGAPYASSSVKFDAGWYGGDGATDTPDRLEMSLDAATYQAGDTATLRMLAEGDGTALVSVLSNRVVTRRVVPVTAGENTVDLTVTPDWGNGAYVTASVLQGMDEATGVNPARQLGLAHATVAPGAKALDVVIKAPEAVDGQAGTLRAAVEVSGVAPGETAYVTLAAVDVGILNLTGFTPPDVTGHYFGQRRLGVDLRDLYGRLIDGLNGAKGAVRSGGDAASSPGVQSPPPTEKLMAFFAGPVTIGADGRAEIEIAKPAFNGTIKLMAVAWSDSAVGDATAEVIAKDPVVVTASLPRYLAPGDESRLLLEFVHASGAAGDASLAVYSDAGIVLEAAPQQITLTELGSQTLSIPVTAREIGDHLITVVLTAPGGKELRKVLSLPVRNNDAETALTRQFALGPGERFTFDRNVFAGLRLGTGTATLSAGPLARMDVPGLLQQLDRYPYGCTEQLTSGAMPLLYLSNIAEAAGLGAPDQTSDKINVALARILTRQSSNGAFGLWRAQSGAFWLDAYVTDFLSRARTQGFDVPDRAFALAMDNLRNRVNYAPDFDHGGQDIAYALLVLAREGAAAMGDLRYYADTKAEAFATPLAVAQLGAALAAYGDPVRSDAMFRRAGNMLARETDNRRWRSDFGSARRDTAAVLKLSAEAGSAVLDPITLATSLQRQTGRFSTQEAAQTVLAAHALTSSAQSQPGLRVDGIGARGPVVKTLSDSSADVSVIENISTRPMDVTMTAYGVPEVPPPAGGYGYNITRSYYTMEGAPVEGPIASGARLVGVLNIAPFEKAGARLIIDDPLPGGFEIDNPNLIRSGDIAELGWLKTANTQMVEFRADRFVAAVDHRDASAFQLAYVVRAVTPGAYHHPAATVEDMYRPAYRANTDTTRVTVTP